MNEEIVELIIPIYRKELDEFDLMVSSGELIRCKDCLFYNGNGLCNRLSEIHIAVNDYWFCADGHRKEKE